MAATLRRHCAPTVARLVNGLSHCSQKLPIKLSSFINYAPLMLTKTKSKHSKALATSISRNMKSSTDSGFNLGVSVNSSLKSLSSNKYEKSISTSSPSAQDNQQSVLNQNEFFLNKSELIANNAKALYYGACVADLDGDGELEIFVCGFGTANLLLKWVDGQLQNVAGGTALEDSERRAIGVAAGDFNGDGLEELYVLNTDTFLGRKKLSDRLFQRIPDGWEDLFSVARNLDEANMCAGRSVCAVDRKGSGRYGFFVANYGGPMRCFEMSEDAFVVDVAREAGLAPYPTGGRSLLALPIISQFAMDIFAANEGGPNFLFVNKGNGSGEYVESAAGYGLMDAEENGRGVAVLDVDGSGRLGIACGNWQGPHRLFAVAGPGPKGGARALGFTDIGEDAGGFVDIAPQSMAAPSPIRTVIAADFDNDGYEELFFNNIGRANRLFRQGSPGQWEEVALGEASEDGGLGTGACVCDIDGDGRLELLVTHGELRPQPLSLYHVPANDNAWLRVKPLTRQGAPARGASVQVQDEGGRWQQRVIDAGSGYLCCMEPVAHFGLGNLSGPVKLRIMWPDGCALDIDSVATKQVLTVPHPP